MAVADHAGPSILGLERRMSRQKLGDFGLDRLHQETPCATAQDFGELILEGPWLNQLDNVIVRHGISLLRWRSEVVKQPHDMPPTRFAPSPTSAHSSLRIRQGDEAQFLALAQRLEQVPLLLLCLRSERPIERGG